MYEKMSIYLWQSQCRHSIQFKAFRHLGYKSNMDIKEYINNFIKNVSSKKN